MSFPLIDYHVHLTEQFTIEMAVRLAEERQMKFGIVEHPGQQGAIKNDDDLLRYIERLRKYPVYAGLQPMYRHWADDFSPNVIDQLDYVLMDADTVPVDGGYLHIWRHNNYIPDLHAFMDQYTAHIENILREEPIQIFARPTYMPVNFGRYYDMVWTEERVDRMISLARARGIAFEISTPMHVPKKEIILAAKSAGLKFTFGTNARDSDAGLLHYGLQMAQECGLTRDDMLVL